MESVLEEDEEYEYATLTLAGHPYATRSKGNCYLAALVWQSY